MNGQGQWIRQGGAGRWTFVALLVAALVLGIEPLATAEAPGASRIVVRFSESVAHPEDPQFIDELSDFVGVPLSYMRAKPGGTHILTIDRLANPAHLERVIKLLARNQEVISVQRDKQRYRRPWTPRGGML